MGKRGNHEGSVYEQKSRGRWAAAYYDFNGKRRILYARTRELASGRLVEALGNVQKGLPSVDQRLTVARFLAQWLEDSARPKLKPSTYLSYEGLIRVHLAPELGKHRLAKLQPRDVQTFLNKKVAEGSSPRRVQMMLAVLKTALNRAVKWQLVHRNVAALVDAPRAPTREIEPLTAGQTEALLATARGHNMEHLFAFMLGTGLRLGEALAVRWSDVDSEARRVRIRQSLEQLPKRPWRFVEPKSASGLRTVPLIGPTLATLRAQRKQVNAWRLRLGEAWQDYDLVFPSELGTPLDKNNVNKRFKTLVRRARLPETMRPHDLRHSTATYLLAAGVDPRIVMQVMGWSQVSMLKRYQHVLDSMLDDAAARLERVFPVAAEAV